jgi:RNA polymerase sigma-70 factor, ECF subfamily
LSSDISAVNQTVDVVLAREDCQLMRQIESGNTDAFEELYERYRARAHRVARSICHDDDRAEDAVQEAFASIWRGRAPYRLQRGSVAAWLLSVVRYRAIDVARRNGTHATRRAGEGLIESRSAPDDVADQAVARAEAARLHALLERLPEAQREVIALAFYRHLTHTEIATALGLPTGTVKSRVRLGLQKLRAEIEQVVV